MGKDGEGTWGDLAWDGERGCRRQSRMVRGGFGPHGGRKLQWEKPEKAPKGALGRKETEAGQGMGGGPGSCCWRGGRLGWGRWQLGTNGGQEGGDERGSQGSGTGVAFKGQQRDSRNE